MTNEQFYNSFYFNFYQHQRSYNTDRTTGSGSPQHYVALLLEGAAKIVSRQNTLLLEPGDYFYIPAGLKYQSYWYTDENSSIKFYSFGFDFFPSAQPLSHSLQIIHCNDDAKEAFAKLTENVTVNSLSIGRLYTFLGLVADSLEVSPQFKNNQIIEKALEYMNTQSNYTVADIASYCNVSESGIYSIFQRIYGKTPIEVKHQLLSQRATELLTTTDLSVETISELLHFSSSSYFRKIFKTQTGKTPLEVRKAAASLYKI